MSRDWENWDVRGVAGEIQTIWRSSEEEDAHREQLANIVFSYASNRDPSILEVGCGTGLIYEKLANKTEIDIEYTGVDSSIKMLEIARQNFPGGQFLFGDGYELFFRNQEFDIVLCFEVLGHIPQIEHFVKELLRTTNRICLFTIWPSRASDVEESYEIIDGVRFLHRNYSEEYIRKIISLHSRDRSYELDTIPLLSGGLAYVVSMNS